MMSFVVTKLNRVFRVEPVLRREPALRQGEGLAAGVALVGAGEDRERLDRLPLLVPPLDRAVREAERERGVGVGRATLDREARLGDPLLVLLHYGVDLVLERAADGARVRIDGGGEREERIVRRLHGRLAAVPQLLADRDVTQLRGLDDALRDLLRRFLAEELLHRGVIRAQPLADLGEGVAEEEPLELGVDRRLAEELLGERGQVRLAVLAQPVRVRLPSLGRAAHEVARNPEERAVPEPVLERVVLVAELQHPLLRLRDRVEGGQRVLPARVLRELRLQRVLLRDERAEEGAILEGEQPAAERLVAVLHVEEVRVRDALLLGAEQLEAGEEAAQLREALQPVREHDVPLHRELCGGERPVCAAGVAGDERELARLRSLRRPAEPVLHLRRLAALVHAQERHVEVVAREHEVVWIASEERDRELRREH